jgi:hypothetical protein
VDYLSAPVACKALVYISNTRTFMINIGSVATAVAIITVGALTVLLMLDKNVMRREASLICNCHKPCAPNANTFKPRPTHMHCQQSEG